MTTALAIAVGLLALVLLAHRDPKRRRIFSLAKIPVRRTGWLLGVLFLPGLALLALGNPAGFVFWLGSLSVCGWGIAALSPSAVARNWLRLRSVLTSGRSMLRKRFVNTLPAWRGQTRLLERIAACEERIAVLEAELTTPRPSLNDKVSAHPKG